jgi:hypothetical protein
MAMLDKLFQVTTSFGCFAIYVAGNVVTNAAPIARWTIGKDWRIVRAYYEKKNAKVKEIK